MITFWATMESRVRTVMHYDWLKWIIGLVAMNYNTLFRAEWEIYSEAFREIASQCLLVENCDTEPLRTQNIKEIFFSFALIKCPD